jgi:hypothetical protein
MSTINLDLCRICLSDFADDQESQIITRVHGEGRVPHDFHEKCLDTWLKTRAKASHLCPSCLVPLSEKNVTFFKRGIDGQTVKISHTPLKIGEPIVERPSEFPLQVTLVLFIILILILYPEYRSRLG